ncbi:MAG TPA: M20/M25/M40 family metallo-hydrolase, partial [Luteibaculaceae bacterium]|nr:M20/M25/M40 family metallo-hydrolase [Luteibaculaceae bacterium]
PMNPSYKDTFKAYSEAVDQRSNGAWQAARFGAIAVLVRSMTLKKDAYAHTGAVNYQDSLPRIPAMALSTEDADWLSNTLKSGVDCRASLQLSATWFADTLSHNVVGEIRGTQKRDEIITIGGHLDSWDLGEGAHDDGAGIVHSLEAIRLMKKNKIKPVHTIRCVLFMNEENGNRGGLTYAKLAAERGEKHIAAMESDRGGFKPEAFSVDASETALAAVKQLQPQLDKSGIKEIYAGYGGVDIGPLKKVNPGIVLIGLVPESTLYFNYHHAETDVLEAVNPDHLQAGAQAFYEMLVLIDKNL